MVSGACTGPAWVLFAVAVSENDPLSRSVWVIVCEPVHVTEAPDASGATGVAGLQLKLSSAGLSVTVTFDSCAFCAVVMVYGACTGPAWVLFAVAVSESDPLSRSVWVIVCEPVHVTEAPGASDATGVAGLQLKLSSAGLSVTVTFDSVVFPELVATSV